MMLGSWLAKRIVQRIQAHKFLVLMDGLMLFAGILMLWGSTV